MEPSVSTILDLMDGPALTHKGAWLGWFGGVLICVIAALAMLFADELFRWNASSPTARISSTIKISGSMLMATAKAKRTNIPLE